VTTPTLAHLEDVAATLDAAGYVVATQELANVEALVAETAYALIACIEIDGWDRVEDTVFDVQAAFTRFADDAPSARNWDLYLVILIAAPASHLDQLTLAETIQADTRYARKFVRVSVTLEELDRALRPLLPLRPPADLAIRDPLAELRDELASLNVADDLANVAIEGFRSTSSVEVP
jgi:hypothetical protein